MVVVQWVCVLVLESNKQERERDMAMLCLANFYSPAAVLVGAVVLYVEEIAIEGDEGVGIAIVLSGCDGDQASGVHLARLRSEADR